MDWHQDQLSNGSEPAFDETAQRVAERIGRTSMSSSFSGVGCPEHASHALSASVLANFGIVSEATFLFTQEKHPHCRDELALLPRLSLKDLPTTAAATKQVTLDDHVCQPVIGQPAHCQFGEMEEFLNPRVRDRLLGNADAMRFEDLEEAVVTRRDECVFIKGPKCRRHKRECALTAASIHTAGTPCVTFSKMPGDRPGTKKGAGYGVLSFMIWVAQRLMLQEQAILHEHVGGFHCLC